MCCLVVCPARRLLRRILSPRLLSACASAAKARRMVRPSRPRPCRLSARVTAGTVVVTVSDGANKSQTLTLQTPNTLPGIPVSSGGNYTDENGQQWVCDEVDLARGVYVQHVTKIKLTSSMKWTKVGNKVDRYFAQFDGTYATNVLCTHFSTSVGSEVVGGATTRPELPYRFRLRGKGYDDRFRLQSIPRRERGICLDIACNTRRNRSFRR